MLGGFTLLVTLLVSPVGALDPAGHNTVWAPLATIYAAYIPVLQTRNRRRSIAAVVLLTIIVTRPWDPSVTVLMVGLGRTAFGPLFAMYVDARHRLVRALRERAERAEREQYLLAEQAIASERARIAGEMHDVVSHRVSLMVLQAGALRMTAPDDATRRAAEELRAGGCQALDELRDLVGILRRPEVGEDTADQPRQPEPTTVDLVVLADESSAVGTPVDLLCTGDPSVASPIVARTAYRILQEALTNVRKHAPGAEVRVRVRYDADRVNLTVLNSAPLRAPDAGLVGTGSGLGLVHLRHRVELVDGTLATGPVPGGGFRVEASLPAYVATSARVAPAGR